MKKQIKRFSSLILAGAMIFALAACGQTSNTPAQSNTGEVSSSDTQKSEPTPDSTAAGSKTLVVYFSATGNTQRVAQDIATVADADLFAITPVQPYTSDDLDWTNNNSRVSREHDDESLRNVKLTTTQVDNWDDYDTVFIGYPIWWDAAAWPVDNFVKDNNFTGKTAIPFATSSSSDLGESGDLLAEMAGTGDWQNGQRFSSSADQSEVTEWVNGLHLSHK